MTSPATPEQQADLQARLHQTEARLEALEIKASFTEDLVDKLEHIIVRQQQTLDAMLAQLRALREQTTHNPDGVAPRNLRDELPPHY